MESINRNSKVNELDTNKQLALKYYILTNNLTFNSPQYNYYQKIFEEFKKQNDIACLDYYVHNFASFENIIKAIINNTNYNELINNEIFKGNYNKIILLIQSLTTLFSQKKEENIDIYNRLIEINKNLNTPSFYEIYNNLSNPLDNTDLIKELNRQMLHKKRVDIRETTLKTDKDVEYRNITIEGAFETTKQILKDTIDYYLKRYKLKKDHSIIKNDDEYEIIKNFMDKNLDKLTRLFNDQCYDCYNESEPNKSINFDRICSNIKSESLANFIKKLNDGFYFLIKGYGGDHIDEMNDEMKAKLKQPDYKQEYGRGCTADIRIYINTSRKYRALFLNEYIKKCHLYGLNIDMKGFTQGCNYKGKGKDKTVLYLSLNDLPLNIKILEEIKEEHPNWINSFGTPSHACSKYHDSYYGICHNGSWKKNDEASSFWGYNIRGSYDMTYNDFFDELFIYSFGSQLCHYICNTDLINNVDMKYKEAIINFSKLRNIDCSYNDQNIFSIRRIKINNFKFFNLLKYLLDNNYIEKLQSKGFTLNTEKWLTGIKERMQVLHNIGQGFALRSNISPSISNYMLSDLNIKKEDKFIEESIFTSNSKKH